MSTTTSASDNPAYDPDVYENQLVAVYDTRAQADAARDALVAAGISHSAIQVLDRGPGDTGRPATDEGFWGTLKSLFAPEEDINAYSHAIGRGHAMVVVTPGSASERQTALRTLETTDPIDFDARLEEWRQSGYDYSQPNRSLATTETATAESAIGGAAVTDTSLRSTAGLTPSTPSTVESSAARADDQETLKVVEERLRVGKREVTQGAVRLRSYVVERPVEEQVRLREERVTVERRPVDRPASPDEIGAFQERTIEARSTAEEAVVDKEARVVEEVGLRKEATERVETVRDTVRRTEVEVDDGTKLGTGSTTNPAPGVTNPRR